MIEEGKWYRRVRRPRKPPPEGPAYFYRVWSDLRAGQGRFDGTTAHAPVSRMEMNDARGKVLAWCRDQFGREGDRWANREFKPANSGRHDRQVGFLFRDFQDAMSFMLRWR